MAKRLVSTGHFVAVDLAGRRVLLEILTEFEDIVSAGYFRSEARRKFVRTTAGQSVNRIEHGRYQIAETDVMLTSNHPLAP